MRRHGLGDSPAPRCPDGPGVATCLIQDHEHPLILPNTVVFVQAMVFALRVSLNGAEVLREPERAWLGLAGTVAHDTE